MTYWVSAEVCVQATVGQRRERHRSSVVRRDNTLGIQDVSFKLHDLNTGGLNANWRSDYVGKICSLPCAGPGPSALVNIGEFTQPLRQTS